MEPEIDADFTKSLELFAGSFFTGLGVKFMQQPDLQAWGIKSRLNCGIKQYNATCILNQLKAIKPKDAYCMIAILMTDIYNKESWNYVFGLASL